MDLVPTPELLRAAVSDARVTQLVANGLGVYMITRMKTISEAGVTVASAKGSGWVTELRVGNPNEQEGVVFALEVKEVKVEGDEVVLKELDTGKEALQGRLVKEFGEEAFTVREGVDEVSGEPCLTVTSNPIFVDLLTSGTAKVGGEHGIWY